jgi:hypothetical protein
MTRAAMMNVNYHRGENSLNQGLTRFAASGIDTHQTEMEFNNGRKNN